MTATLYGGNITGESFVDVNTHLYSMSGKFDAIDVAQLLKDSAKIDTLSGKAQGTYYFASQGEDASVLKQHLHGRGRLQVQQGVLTGVDLNYIFAQAKALLKGAKNTASDQGRTQFSQLSATIEAQDGILTNNDFRLSSDTFQLGGKGKYQLLDNFLDYTTQVVFNEKSEEGSPSLKKLPLGLRISGHPPKLVYLPDFESLFKALLQQQIKTQSNKLLDKLSSELGADFGEGAKNALERGLGGLQTLPFEDAIQKQ
jgi:AsmA protein